MSKLWLGEAGPTHWYCPYHGTFWQDEHDYGVHMRACHAVAEPSVQMEVASIDRENGTVTLRAVQDGVITLQSERANKDPPPDQL